MDVVITYVSLSVMITVLFVAAMMRKEKQFFPYPLDLMIYDLGMSKVIVEQIRNKCDKFKKGDGILGYDAIYLCAYTGQVFPDDINVILEYFPGMISEPVYFKRDVADGVVKFDDLLNEMGVVR